jgi:cytochrome c biogenesis protein CcdA
VLLASVVEWDALLKVVWASAAATVGVTLVFSLAIVGATGLAESRRDGRPIAAIAFGLLAVVGLLVCAAAVVFGIALMVSKE